MTELREVIKQMPKDIFDGNCKDCPSLEHCLDMGVGCYKVIPRETYSVGHNEEQIKHGRWEKVERDKQRKELDKLYHIYPIKCSCCGGELERTLASVSGLNYCPNCGAKMDEVTRE